MATLSTGPVARDQLSAVIEDWHLQAFNNTTSTSDVTLIVYALRSGKTIKQVEATTKPVLPGEFRTFTIKTRKKHRILGHTLAVVVHDKGPGEILLTVQGRHSKEGVPGATYRHADLIVIPGIQEV